MLLKPGRTLRTSPYRPASSAVHVLAVPLGTALRGPLVAGLGARETLLVSAASIVLLGSAAAGTARAWRDRRQ
ncbi:hypothetical protein AB0O22_02485 [Streptomyces sp. NPDC091204]|uniref:hypothetical protein n=1 Tax=Streptomyces sp. NPDC091204 TaxID=3155299 RepID=UPI00341DF1FC